MKKIVSLVLVFLILIGCFSVSVNAQSDTMMMLISTKKLHNASNAYHKESAENSLSKYVGDVPYFIDMIMEAISNCSATFDLSGYSIPTSVYYDISDYIFYGMPEAFNVQQVGCSYYPVSDELAYLTFTYNSFADTVSEYSNCFAEMTSAANKILTGIKGNTELSDEQKLLLLHDRLAIWNTYGYPVNTTKIEAHTAYGALANKMSVCQGYAMAYMYLLNQVDIESYYCSSDVLNHGWNIVFLNGKKYHVDVTWDDPTPDRLGRVEHENFLRSSIGIYYTGHEAVDFDFSPSDTTYDDYFWHDSKAEFQLVNNELYYINHTSEDIRRYSDGEILCSVDAEWLADSNSVWGGNYSCLSNDGTSLFYSQPQSIYRFDLTANESEEIYTPSVSQYESVFGFSYQDETLICDISNSPNYVSQRMEQSYKYDYDDDTVYGDTNGDGKINGRDYAMLIQYINGALIDISLENADVNSDGKINGRDYALLIQYLNGWPITLGPKS